jgi:hypothetical protein
VFRKEMVLMVETLINISPFLPRLKNEKLVKFNIAFTLVVFIVSIFLILALGGLSAYCIYKGGYLTYAVKVSSLYFKIACKIPRR